MQKYIVLPWEIEELKNKIQKADLLKQEIKELGLTANEQGGETFGHDNPILESKHEKESMLSLMLPEIRKIQKILQQCLILDENQDYDLQKVSIGCLVTFQIDNGVYTKALVTGVTQGKKMTYKGNECMTICSASPIRKGFAGKSIGDTTKMQLGGNEKTIKIIKIEI